MQYKQLKVREWEKRKKIQTGKNYIIYLDMKQITSNLYKTSLKLQNLKFEL